MLNPETFAVEFARALELIRTQASKEEQKQQFRLLLGLLKDGGALMRVADGRLYVNGTPVDVPQVVALRDRLDLYGVGEMALPYETPAAHLYELLRALADVPGLEAESLTDRLRQAGVDRLSVTLAAIDLAPPSAPAVPPPPAGQALEREPPAQPKSPQVLGTGGLLRGDPMSEFASAPVEGTSDVVKEASASDAATAALPLSGRAEVNAASFDPDAPVEEVASPPQEPSAAPPPPPAADLAAGTAPPAETPIVSLPEPPGVPAAPTRSPRTSVPEIAKRSQKEPFAAAEAHTRATDQVLSDLAASPDSPAVLDTLAVLSRQIESAMTAGRIEEVLRIVAGVVRIAQDAPETSRRSYAIALKRVLTKPMLKAFVTLVAAPQYRDAALYVLARGGDDAIEVLMDRLATAPTIEERRNLFGALGQMKHGHQQLTRMLNHNQWFVARNVAELLGELGHEGSATALSKQLAHPDERVRGAVALALAKIGTAGAVEPLRRALRDPAAGVRLQVALGVGGRKAGALAMPIVVAIDQEQDQDIARELMLALGRIGSPDAVQALIKFAQPGGMIFGRKPTSRRLAAVEALRVAATPAAIGTLQGLSHDSEKDVKSAARAALAELKP